LRITSCNLSITGSHTGFLFNDQHFEIETSLIGRYNTYNILAAVGASLIMDISPQTIKYNLTCFSGVPGRLERINGGKNITAFIDYAHTEDALRNVLQAVKPLCQGILTVVFGCGGDRDKSKRPKMGKTAAELADKLVLTNDNPRSEKFNWSIEVAVMIYY